MTKIHQFDVSSTFGYIIEITLLFSGKLDCFIDSITLDFVLSSEIIKITIFE